MPTSQRIGWILFWLVWMSCSTARAAEIITPETVPGSTRVNAEEVIDLVEKVSNLVIIDARIALDRKQGFIEGSHSLPDVETTCISLAKLAPGKKHPVLFYCNGVKCGRSAKAIATAQSCGYATIYWFRGGFEEWKAKAYPFVTE